MTIEIGEKSGARVPHLHGRDLAIGDVVSACYAQGVDEALSGAALPFLTRDALKPILTYCAEQRCAADNATCPGCRRRTQSEGVASFDDFVARHREIVVGNGAVRLTGRGDKTLAVASLDDLAKSWAGEELWFIARRVIRRMVKEDSPNIKMMAGPLAGAGPQPAVILVRPQLADNIGAAARAMANFGLEEMRLVAPRDGWPNDKARIAASGADFIVDAATSHPTLAGGVSALNWVAATTARQRDLAKPVLTPEQAVAEMRRRLAEGQRVGILFGAERTGLEQDEIALADAIIMAPVNTNFASLNLAQAVLLLSYEWMKQSGGGTLGRVTTYESPIAAGARTRGSPPASKEQLLGFFGQLEEELDKMGFLRPPHKRPTMVQNMRTMFTRMAPTEQEVRTLRGIVKALVYGKGEGRKLP